MGRPKRTAAQAADETLVPPAALAPNQTLVRVVRPEGSNLFLCALPRGRETILLELAQRFRNTVWLKRGGFALAERYEEGAAADTRARGEIVNIVRGEKDWRKMPYWPKEFAQALYDEEDDEESTVGKMPPSDSEDE